MRTEFIPYTEALALKELGFDKECVAYYNGYNKLDHLMPERVFVLHDYNGENTTSAPTFSQAFRWFREKYNLYIVISHNQYWVFEIYTTSNDDLIYGESTHKSYEEAELECLKKLIEIVKKKNE